MTRVRIFNHQKPEYMAKMMAAEWERGWMIVDSTEKLIDKLRDAAKKYIPKYRRFRHKSSRFGASTGPLSYPYIEFNGREARGVNDDGTIRLLGICHTIEAVCDYVSQGTWIEVEMDQ